MAKPIKKNSQVDVADQVSPLGLPRALARLKGEKNSSAKFDTAPEKEYSRSLGLKGDDSPPLKEFLPDYKPDDFFSFVARSAKAKDKTDIAEAMRQLKPELFDAFQEAQSAEASHNEATTNLPTVAPALWEERTTGREVSPADFIRKHYAQWLGKGLTRAHIGQLDEKLYAAYARQISRSPDKAIAELPTEPRQKRSDPDEALDRIRAQTRASVARSRKAM